MMVVAHDVFMDDGDEKNLLIFRRDASGAIVSLIERRKFNDLLMQRGSMAVGASAGTDCRGTC